MSSAILYTNNCPRCKILKRKLDEGNILYSTVDDTEVMIAMKFTTVPMLEVDGQFMNYYEAVKWVSNHA